jgi:hypothetical protein
LIITPVRGTPLDGGWGQKGFGQLIDIGPAVLKVLAKHGRRSVTVIAMVEFGRLTALPAVRVITPASKKAIEG